MWASKEGHLKIVEYLLKAGADVEAKDIVSTVDTRRSTKIILYTCIHYNIACAFGSPIYIYIYIVRQFYKPIRGYPAWSCEGDQMFSRGRS